MRTLPALASNFLALPGPSAGWLSGARAALDRFYVTQVSMRMRLTEGLWRSSVPGAGGLPRPSGGEWKSARWSSRSLPSYEEQEELRLSTGERPMSGRPVGGWGGCC